jgi:hypothetical protein
MKRHFHSDGQQFHQYQLSENSPNPKPQINEIYIKNKKKRRKKKTTAYNFGNSVPGLEQAQTCHDGCH